MLSLIIIYIYIKIIVIVINYYRNSYTVVVCDIIVNEPTDDDYCDEIADEYFHSVDLEIDSFLSQASWKQSDGIFFERFTTYPLSCLSKSSIALKPFQT